MLRDALSFPRSGDDWVPTLVIGGLLTAASILLSFLIVPGLILQGYLVRVLRASATGESDLPSFTDWGRLLVDGLKLLVINIAYSVVLVVPYVALFFLLGVGGNDGLGALALVVTLVVLVLALAISYVIPAALTNFAIEGDFGAAFDFGTIRSGAFTADYATAWVLAVVVGLVGGLVGAALSIFIVGLFVLFYVQVAVYYLFGRGFAKGLGRTSGETAAPTATV